MEKGPTKTLTSIIIVTTTTTATTETTTTETTATVTTKGVSKHIKNLNQIIHRKSLTRKLQM